MVEIAFVIEQALGHITHSQNLERNFPPNCGIQPHWLLIPYETHGLAARLPVYRSNWTVRAGLRGRRALSELARRTRLDGLFFHTQVPGVLSADWARRYPTVVSLDATPLQYDQLGEVYRHARGPEWLEKIKFQMNCNLFNAAARLVAWTEWTKESLVNDYGIPAEKIVIISPGVTPELWAPPDPLTGEGSIRRTEDIRDVIARNEAIPKDGETDSGGSQTAVRILFVGGDLARKGGDLLIEVFRALRISYPFIELHLVTKTQVAPQPGLFVYSDLGPNDPRLIRLYHQADIFTLPTLGDCLPMVLSEAGAAGLPCVSTRVAGIPEIIADGESGLLITPRDGQGLKEALDRLITDAELRQRMGQRASQIVRERFDSARNTEKLMALLKETIEAKADGGKGKQGSHNNKTLLTVSGQVPADVEAQIAAGKRPRADYIELAHGLPADLLDYRQMRAEVVDPPDEQPPSEIASVLAMTSDAGFSASASRVNRLIERIAGANAALAWACFQKRASYRVILTDGEQVGIPLALLLKWFGRGSQDTRHLMIVHILSVGKKKLFFDWLGIQSHIDRFLVYATWQKQFIEGRWRVPPERVILTPFMVDQQFFRPDFKAPLPSPDWRIKDIRRTKDIRGNWDPPEAVDSESQVDSFLAKTADTDHPTSAGRLPLICAVGLEYRDYPTLLEAVRGLDVQVVIAAASPWSKRSDNTQGQDIPPNVTVRRFSQYELRQLYADSNFVVMPLYPVEFQAGVTAILEAMAMGKAVICTRTPGQTDVLVDGESGLYVPPQDPAALREAIQHLIARPEESARLGANGRTTIEENMNIDSYVSRLRKITEAAAL